MVVSLLLMLLWSTCSSSSFSFFITKILQDHEYQLQKVKCIWRCYRTAIFFPVLLLKENLVDCIFTSASMKVSVEIKLNYNNKSCECHNIFSIVWNGIIWILQILFSRRFHTDKPEYVWSYVFMFEHTFLGLAGAGDCLWLSCGTMVYLMQTPWTVVTLFLKEYIVKLPILKAERNQIYSFPFWKSRFLAKEVKDFSNLFTAFIL